ncbi:pre-mRNA-splicing factor Syf2-like [Paramacrobiotus metropolitanus]|uniref:pre-mRNA-splicing factor Syf2-like n=1 Tax=Paramacrobiotus metropolitanus TaxID=2943436 RepID=UPI002445789A|nr:pre-mRNA-splicing factor Syf2-like [Paramacrobiotus metropolitanus]
MMESVDDSSYRDEHDVESVETGQSVHPVENTNVDDDIGKEEATSSQGTSSGSCAKTKHEERMRKLRALHMKRNEARSLNHKDVVAEDYQRKLPKNWEAKRARMEWKLDDEEKRKDAEEQGEDYDRLRMLDVTAAEASAMDAKKRRKKNPDMGFSTFEDATIRQYDSLTRNIKPNFKKYEQQKEELGDKFYASASTILHDEVKDSPEAIERLVDDVKHQAERRAKFSRRRAYNPESEIDYINEKNMNFNKKLERFYGQYTSETKQNLERGTAV